MRFTTLVAPNKKKTFLVRLKGDVATPIGLAYQKPGLDPLREMLDADRNPAQARAIARPFPVKRGSYRAVVTAPSKIIGIGLNYRKHAAEGGMTVPKEPMSFAKYNNSLIGTGQTIRYRRKDSRKVDYEGELAVVIGRRARDVPAKRALDYVFGYTICNDVSARDHQMAEGQYSRAKSFDTFSPLGPVIVTTDEIPDPQTLDIRTRVNGKVVQDSNTNDMVHGCADLVAYLSRFMTLEPGDVISTGTPEGVGFVRKPPILLTHGTVVEIEIEKIGVLRNRVCSVANLT